MPEYELQWSDEHGNHVDDEGRSSDELLDDNEVKEQVSYSGNTETIVTRIEEEEEEEFECPEDGCERSFDSPEGRNSHFGQAH